MRRMVREPSPAKPGMAARPAKERAASPKPVEELKNLPAFQPAQLALSPLTEKKLAKRSRRYRIIFGLIAAIIIAMLVALGIIIGQ
jgi:hypothetical protein